MTSPNLLQQAQQGNCDAIAILLSQVLRAQAVAVKVRLQAEQLQILLEAPDVPQAGQVVPLICRGLLRLQIASVRSVQLQGRQSGESVSDWSAAFQNNKRSLLRQMAKWGDEQAIATLFNQALAPKNIAVLVSLQKACLQVTLTLSEQNEQAAATQLIQREFSSWQSHCIETLQITHTLPDTESLIPQILAVPEPKPASRTATPSARHSPPRRPLPRPPRQQMQPRMQHQPAPAWSFKFDPLKFSVVVALAAYGLVSAPDYTVIGFLNAENGLMMFLHGVNLIFHEAGHTLLILFGQFIYILGGSLMQIAVPAGICGYFFYTQQRFASAVTLCWVGENFWDVSIYIKDATFLLLPLLGGEGTIHDWRYLLHQLHLLPHAQLIGNLAYAIGVLIYGFAIFAGVFYAQRSLPTPSVSTLD